MAPRMAMVMAGERSPLMLSQLSDGMSASGTDGLISKRSPMVSTWMLKYSVMMMPAMVMTMIATSEPGTFLLTMGVQAMMTMERMPTMAVARSTEEKFWK